jgi:hypothetical protein
VVAFWVLLLEGCFGITFREIAKLGGVMLEVLGIVCLERTCFNSVVGAEVRAELLYCIHVEVQTFHVGAVVLALLRERQANLRATAPKTMAANATITAVHVSV